MTQTIMIAANDPNIIYLLQRYAEESGFQTVKAGQDTDVLNLVQQVKPALIIVEVNPPGTMGWEVLRWLKTEPSTCNIPVVVYPYLGEEMGERLEGVVGYLQESVMYDDFLATLENAGLLADSLSDDS
ncbi:MAG: response regulator [Anaerolineae bacterium]|nr:response regulator [Anaerolineae bacterium]